MTYRVISLFAGIGGFDLGLERTGGFKTVAFCEIDPYCQRVLRKHWPEVPVYDDVRTLTADALRRDGIAVDIICGGSPCQDFSVAGKRAGIDSERSGLWFEYCRLIGEIRPRWVIFENVPGILTGGDEIELPPHRCVCGWDSRWGGVHIDAREARLQRHPRPRGHRDVHQGAVSPAAPASGIRRQDQEDAQQERQMGRSRSASSDGSRTAPFLGTSDAAFDSKAVSSRARHTAAGSDRILGQRDFGQETLDAGGDALSNNFEGPPARGKQARAGDGSGAWLVCPSCGRGMGNTANRSVYITWLGRVQGGLAALGYHAVWSCIPASSVGAPHQRDRFWLVANASDHRHGQPLQSFGQRGGDVAPDSWCNGSVQLVANSARAMPHRSRAITKQKGLSESSDSGWWETEPGIRRVAHGIPARVDRLRSLGNAVVPQIPELIGRAILAADAA